MWPRATDIALQPNVRFRGYSDRTNLPGNHAFLLCCDHRTTAFRCRIKYRVNDSTGGSPDAAGPSCSPISCSGAGLLKSLVPRRTDASATGFTRGMSNHEPLKMAAHSTHCGTAGQLSMQIQSLDN